MSFQPILPLGGLPGWAFLGRTLERQQAAFASSAPVQRATDHFRANIASATSAEALVADRRLLQVALGAFGLENDIDARAFIRQVLEQGTTSDRALASRLADKRYAQLAAAFGYGDPREPAEPEAAITPDDYADTIIARIRSDSISAAAAEQDNNLRLALDLAPELTAVLANAPGNRAGWHAVMDNPSLRTLFATALDLPPGGSRFDSSPQPAAFRAAARAAFGTDDLAAFVSGPTSESLLHRFLVRAHGSLSDNLLPAVQRDSFAENIIARYIERQFESAVGEQDNDLRLALNLGPGLDELLDTTSGDRARWFALMGNPPLRRVFEVALGLPDSFGRLDIDQQLTTFRDRSQAIFGSADLADLASPDQREALTRRFLLRAEAAAFNATTNTASIALTLLSQAAPIRWPGAHAAYGAW